MHTKLRRRTAAILAAAAVALGSQAGAETRRHTKLMGLIHDYTPALDPSGPWQVVGEWSLTLYTVRGKVDFVASLNMVRSEDPARAAHTHHMRLSDGQITALSNGFRISGTGIFTSNGALVGFSGSPVDIEITGSGAVPFANVAVIVGGGAAAHFGVEPLNGVVTLRRSL
jgi:hypothetical protein